MILFFMMSNVVIYAYYCLQVKFDSDEDDPNVCLGWKDVEEFSWWTFNLIMIDGGGIVC